MGFAQIVRAEACHDDSFAAWYMGLEGRKSSGQKQSWSHYIILRSRINQFVRAEWATMTPFAAMVYGLGGTKVFFAKKQSWSYFLIFFLSLYRNGRGIYFCKSLFFFLYTINVNRCPYLFITLTNNRKGNKYGRQKKILWRN
jgi:hypothetical protein